MKIVHIGLTGSYNDNWSYQENNIIHYQRKMNHEVSLITTPFINDQNSSGYKYFKTGEYYDKDGAKIIRLPLKFKFINKRISKFRTYKWVIKYIEKEIPDILFIHGLQFLDIWKIANYLKGKPDIKLFVDNHCDYSNSATNWISKKVLHGIIWRAMAKKIEPYVSKFYGVLPARVDFLLDLYDLPQEKTELLVMGADDEKVIKSKNDNSRKNIREKYEIKDEDFLIVTGGKIDEYKKQVILLQKAIKELNNPNIKLIIFGSIIEKLKDEIVSLCDNSQIIYVGWIKSDQTYQYIEAADLVIYPGRHSILWEQTVGQGVPMICKYWNGTTHVDLGGNVKFLKEDSVDEIKRNIENIINDKELYNRMKNISVNKGMNIFSYMDISERSIR